MISTGRAASWLSPPDGGNTIVAGIAAGVVTEAQQYSQSGQQGVETSGWNTPGTWAYIWVGVSVVYLVGVYIGAIRPQQ